MIEFEQLSLLCKHPGSHLNVLVIFSSNYVLEAFMNFCSYSFYTKTCKIHNFCSFVCNIFVFHRKAPKLWIRFIVFALNNFNSISGWLYLDFFYAQYESKVGVIFGVFFIFFTAFWSIIIYDSNYRQMSSIIASKILGRYGQIIALEKWT